MSVIQELYENYDHIPHEFKRGLLMMRELDEVVVSKYSANTLRTKKVYLEGSLHLRLAAGFKISSPFFSLR